MQKSGRALRLYVYRAAVRVTYSREPPGDVQVRTSTRAKDFPIAVLVSSDKVSLGSVPKRFEGGCAARTKHGEEGEHSVSAE